MHNAVNGSVKRAKQRRTKAGEKRQEKEQWSRASLKGAELKQAEAEASNEPANQPVSQPASQLSRRPIANREAMTLARG